MAVQWPQICLLCIFIVIFGTSVVVCDSIVGEYGKPCTYFGGARVSSPQSSLINCSWYAPNACCQRTEVTSVFGGMYPLYGASKECANMMNYMMCYFCSPNQYKWYNKKAFVCADYCESLYAQCRRAEYKGEAIEDGYESGIEFCRGQKFEVVEPGEGDCFDFDPLVFGEASPLRMLMLLTVISVLLSLLAVL